MITILKGNIIFTKEKEAFNVHENSFIVIENKKVLGIYKDLPEYYRDNKITDYGNAIIFPSFIDLHIHAPQFMQMGIGLNLELIDWLNQYTFVLEQRFENVEYARKVYPHFADALLKNGTLRSVIFGTIHNESNNVLVEELKQKGLSAFVGKVNMNQNAPEALLQTTEVSVKETEEFILCNKWNELVKPIITPRFAPSCTKDLLQALGNLSKKHNIPVQSHLAENIQEIEWVKELFPNSKSYSDVYKKNDLYGEEKTLMAHAVYLDEEEIDLAKNKNIILVHCPNSNINLTSGIMPVTKYLDNGLHIGLGSDVGGGHSISMNHSIKSAIQCSKMLHIFDPSSRILTEAEAFYLATKANGRFFGKVGSFEEGYMFDALIIKDPHPLTGTLTPLEQLERFLYCGNTESIIARYLEGKLLSC